MSNKECEYCGEKLVRAEDCVDPVAAYIELDAHEDTLVCPTLCTIEDPTTLKHYTN
ncbi:MAG: hypothetical protein KGH64_03250 [Candidatus Micrarchaeota archaeon]|nr:hypothetical protein [Candidatus Micrarchaeota archaeon]MDE1859196.1 hypothetical protein [Candidatus Micrarchaeota archaeon]